MAVRDTFRKPFIEDNDEKISIGLDLPITRDNDLNGYFATTSTTIEAVKNNIQMLLSTEEGERIFQPNIGLGLRAFLFEQITHDSIHAIQSLIVDKFKQWLPFVNIVDIVVNSRDQDPSVGANTISISINFNIKKDPNALGSVTVDVQDNTVAGE